MVGPTLPTRVELELGCNNLKYIYSMFFAICHNIQFNTANKKKYL